MKKLILFSVLILADVFAQGAYLEEYQLNSASFTKTNEGPISISSNTMKGGVFIGVVIDSQSAGGSVTFADSYVATSVAGISYSTFAILQLSGGNNSTQVPSYIPFNVRLSSGLSYTTSGNAGGITIIYKSLKAQ